jgi:zinc transporter 1/2/3
MFNESVEVFGNPCLPEEWKGYPAWAAIFAMVGAFFVQGVQTAVLDHFANEGDHGHAHDSGPDLSLPTNGGGATSSGVVDKDNSALKSISVEASAKTVSTPEIASLALMQTLHSDGCGTHDVVRNVLNHKHKRITTFLLEGGVVLHSVVIGVALGVSGSEFVVLLIAICAHQFFEGLAIASAALDCGFKTVKMPLLLALLFACMTPLGQVIGILVSQSYDANSASALLSQGILSSLSAGILIYDGFVNLMTPTITHNHAFPKYAKWQKASMFGAMWVGAAIMSVIGAYA